MLPAVFLNRLLYFLKHGILAVTIYGCQQFFKIQKGDTSNFTAGFHSCRKLLPHQCNGRIFASAVSSNGLLVVARNPFAVGSTNTEIVMSHSLSNQL